MIALSKVRMFLAFTCPTRVRSLKSGLRAIWKVPHLKLGARLIHLLLKIDGTELQGILDQNEQTI